jgi:hypothetical protein
MICPPYENLVNQTKAANVKRGISGAKATGAVILAVRPRSLLVLLVVSLPYADSLTEPGLTVRRRPEGL